MPTATTHTITTLYDFIASLQQLTAELPESESDALVDAIVTTMSREGRIRAPQLSYTTQN